MNLAEVISTGPGRLDVNGKRVAMSVKTGDTVVIPEYGGQHIQVDSDSGHADVDMYVMVRNEDIVGIYNKDEASL